MKKQLRLQDLLAAPEMSRSQRLKLFALVTLGMLDSMTRGVLSADEATRLFFHADNGLFVRRQLRSKLADRIMSHGVQLADLFAALSPDTALRETHRELNVMRSLCSKLLESKRLVA